MLLDQNKIDELEDIIKRAEEMLTKSNQAVSEETRRPEARRGSIHHPPPKATPSHSKGSLGSTSSSVRATNRPDNSRMASGAVQTVRPGVSNSNLATSHTAVHSKTQNLNPHGNRRPVVQRSSLVKKHEASLSKPAESLVRSSSASSLKAPVPPAKETEPQPTVRDSQTLAKPRSADNIASDLAKDADYRGSQMETVKSIQNSLKHNLELKRRVLGACKKPSASRLSFLKKLNAPSDHESCQALVRSSGAFKAHQASVLYQRLGCLVLRELFAEESESDIEDHSHFLKLADLLVKLKKIDRLIRKSR